MGTITPITEGTASAVADASRLAELWLDGATTLPAGATRTVAWTPNDWLDGTLDTWKRLCDPVAEQVSGMWVQGLPEEARNMIGPMAGMLTQMGGLTFGSQLGQALGQLPKEVLTSTDIGLPLGPAGTGALLPAAIEAFSEGLEQPRPRGARLHRRPRGRATSACTRTCRGCGSVCSPPSRTTRAASRWTSPRSRRPHRASTRPR